MCIFEVNVSGSGWGSRIGSKDEFMVSALKLILDTDHPSTKGQLMVHGNTNEHVGYEVLIAVAMKILSSGI
jgi:hypothetical protein